MKFLSQFKKLKFPFDQYAIFGSGPMAVRGIRKIKDLDVVVKDKLYGELLKKYKEAEPGKIKIGKIEIFPVSDSLIDDAGAVIDRAEMIEGFKFIQLEDLIKWKQKMGREKDFKDIELIKNYIGKNLIN